MADVPAVTHNTGGSQFEIQTGAGIALLRYRTEGTALDLVHTKVPQSLEGDGYGAALVRDSLEVIPTCPFVRAYMLRHHEYDDLRAAGR